MSNSNYSEGKNATDFFESYLVSVRHPVDRMVSWYIYKHLMNVNATLKVVKVLNCGATMLHTCYASLDDLATKGLELVMGASPPPPTSDAPTVLQSARVGTNLTRKECQWWAWNVIRGDVSGIIHNHFNYRHYAKYFLDDESNEVFVIRMEHLWDDYSYLD